MARRGAVVDRALSVGAWTRPKLNDAVIGKVTSAHGYKPLSVSLDRTTFARSLRPSWATAGAIVLAPTIVGLSLLLVRTRESFTFVVREDHAGVSCRIHGRVHPSVLKEIEVLCAAGSTTVPVAQAPGLASSPLVSTSPGKVTATAVDAEVSGLGGPIGPLPGSLDQASSIGPSAPAPIVSNGVRAAIPSDATRARPMAGSPSNSAPRRPVVTLRFDDGRFVDVATLTLFGRNPASSADDPDAAVVIVNDDTVSKTHLAIGVSGDEAWVADRHSTNGSAVVGGNGAEVPLVPGQRTPIASGASIRLGDVWLRVERFE